MGRIGRILASLGVLAAAAVGHGQFLIVPKGERAGSVTPKAIRAEMDVYDAYATVRLEITFATDPNWSNEVDFMMRLPNQAEATGFAYWFGDEYVVAKTVERERAAQIYEFITSRQRDPALVELVGRRQFRVRIAPIDPSKDLRVEVRLVLTSTRGALALPLSDLFHGRLERADLQVTTPLGWRDNWGRSPRVEGNRQKFEFSSQPWTARSDWRFAPAEPTPVRVSVGRPEQGEGTLLVAFTAPRAIRGLRLTAPPGVLAHVYPPLADVQAGETITFAARVRPAAPNSTVLRIGERRWTQALPRQPFAQRAAVVVWGARHVPMLKRPEDIRRWGILLGIPTKETSWLAVPKAEEQALKEARVQVAARQYLLMVAKRGKDSSESRALLGRVRSLVKDAWPNRSEAQVSTTTDRQVRQASYETLDLLQRQYAEAVARQGARSPKAREFASGVRSLVAGIGEELGDMGADEYLRAALRDALDERVAQLLGYDEPAKRMSAAPPEVDRLVAALGPRNRWLPYALRYALEVAEALRLGGDVENTPENRIVAHNALTLAPKFGNPEDLRGAARASLARSEVSQVAERWAKGGESLDRLLAGLDQVLARYQVTPIQAKDQLLDVAGLSKIKPQPGSPNPDLPLLSEDQRRVLRHYGIAPVELLDHLYGHEYAWAKQRWYGLQVSPRRDPKDLAAARARLEQWARILGKPLPVKEVLLDLPGSGEPARDAYIMALRLHGPDSPITKAARERFEESDRRSGRFQRVPWRAEVLRLDVELDNLVWRQLTPEEAARRDDLEKRRKELFARMGDPLLVVEAPPDASVSARLPDGRLVALTWNGQAMRWEHRFDLPPGTPDGPLAIPVWIRRSGGEVQAHTVRVHVDQTPPRVTVRWWPTEHGWRVEAITEVGVARVNLALADGRRLVFQRTALRGEDAHWQIEVDGPLFGEAIVIATDAAHNRTEVRRSFSP